VLVLSLSDRRGRYETERERERFAQGVTVEPLSNATFAVYPMLVLPEKSKSEMTGMGKRKLQYGNKTSTD
jgi:hypothetical protein